MGGGGCRRVYAHLDRVSQPRHKLDPIELRRGTVIVGESARRTGVTFRGGEYPPRRQVLF